MKNHLNAEAELPTSPVKDMGETSPAKQIETEKSNVISKFLRDHWSVIAGTAAALTLLGTTVSKFIFKVHDQEKTIDQLEERTKQNTKDIKDYAAGLEKLDREIKLAFTVFTGRFDQVTTEINLHGRNLESVREKIEKIDSLEKSSIQHGINLSSIQKNVENLLPLQPTMTRLEADIERLRIAGEESRKINEQSKQKMVGFEGELSENKRSTEKLDATFRDAIRLQETLRNLPREEKATLSALQSIAVLRRSMSVFLEMEATKLVNSMLLSVPSAASAQKLADLERMVMQCKPLFEHEPEPAIHKLIRNVWDVVDPIRFADQAGSKAIKEIESIQRTDSDRAYALAQILLARSKSARSPDKASDIKAREAIGHAENALNVIPSSSSALNVKLINELHLAKFQWEQGFTKDFLFKMAPACRLFAEVERFDETLVGRFKSLNNTAYWFSLSLLTLSHEMENRRIDYGNYETIVDCKLEELIKDITRQIELAVQIPINQSGALDTKAQVYTSLALLIGCDYLPVEKRVAILNSLNLFSERDLFLAKNQLFDIAYEALILANVGGQRSALEKEFIDRFHNDAFFKKWPDELKKKFWFANKVTPISGEKASN